jgi:hypothetical protein
MQTEVYSSHHLIVIGQHGEIEALWETDGRSL